MKTMFTTLMILMASTMFAQSGVGLAIGASPRNTGSLVGTAFMQYDIIMPAETNLLFGAGGLVALEKKQATHYVPYTYAAVELNDFILGLRLGASYTVHEHAELIKNVGEAKWFAYSALHLDYLNDKRVAGFVTLTYSHKNWIDFSMGARFKFHRPE